MTIDLIRASNGSGEAVRSVVTNPRTIGSTTLDVDSLTNYNTEFICTSGDLLADGTLDPATVTVFYGTKNVSQIIIDGFAPGYSDLGNTVGQVVVCKPTTAWADNIADTLAVTLNDDGTLKTDIVTTAKILNSNVTNAKLATGAGQPGGAWTSFTPTLSGRLNDSKWTKTCSYTQIGKTVHYKLELVASNATPMDGGTADAIFTLPVTSISYVGNPIIGDVRCLDSGTAAWYGFVEYVSTTTAYIRLINAAATYAQPGAITSTVPFTWTTSDQIIVIGTYEAA